MNRFQLLLTAVFCISIAAVPEAAARSIDEDAGTSVFSFLKINAGARAVGMGGAFTGLADDENSLYYNPAGIATMERDGIILGYHNYFAGLQSGTVGAIRIYGKHHIGAYINYLNYGTFVQTDNLGNIEGEFGGGDLLFGLTYARRYNDYLFFGMTGKIIYEKIQDYSATGLAIDLGVKYRGDRDRWSAGIMLQNLGVQLSNFTSADKESLPTTLRVGGGIRPRGLPMQFASDIVIPADNKPYLTLGAEYYELDPLFIRAGYNRSGLNYRASDSDDRLAGINLGLGFKWKDKQISYAFSPGADLGDSHRITLTGGITL